MIPGSWILRAAPCPTTMILHAEIAEWYVALLDEKVASRDADREGVEPNLFVAGLEATHASTVGILTNNQARVGDRFEVGSVPLPVRLRRAPGHLLLRQPLDGQLKLRSHRRSLGTGQKPTPLMTPASSRFWNPSGRPTAASPYGPIRRSTKSTSCTASPTS